MSLSPLAKAQAANQVYRERLRAELAQAKEASHQEPFDIHGFGFYYDLHDDHGELRVTPERIEEFEIAYYLDHPEIPTIQAFADFRRRLDAEQAG